MTQAPTTTFEEIQLGLIGSTPRGSVSLEQKVTMKRDQERFRAQHKQSFGRSIIDAVDSEFISEWIARQGVLSSYGGYDPDFVPTEDERKQLFDGLDESLWDEFEKVGNMDQAQVLRGQLLHIQGARQRLQQQGLTGAALRIGAQVVDPIAIMAEIGTVGLAGPAFLVGKGTRVSRLVRGGLVVAAPEVAIESTRAVLDPQAGPKDIIYAGLAAMTLGGAINVALTKGATRATKRIEASDFVDSAMGSAAGPEFSRSLRQILESNLTPDGKRYFDEILSPGGQQAYLDDVISHAGLDAVDDADLVAAIKGMDEEEILERMLGKGPSDEIIVGNPSPEAADPGFAEEIAELRKRQANPDAQPLSEDEVDLLLNFDDPDVGVDIADLNGPPELPPKVANDFTARPTGTRAAYKWARHSFASILGSNPSDEIRKAGSVMAEDALVRAGGAPAPMSATRWVQMTYEAKLSKFQRIHDTEFKKWSARTGNKNHDTFAEEVGKYKRKPVGTPAHPEVKRAAAASDDTIEEALNIGKRHGVRGLEDIEHIPGHMPRIWVPAKISDAIAVLGEETFDDLLAKAIINGSEDAIDPAIAAKMGTGMRKNILSADQMTDWKKSHMVSGELPDEMAMIMSGEGISDEVIETILYRADKKIDKGGGNIARSKHRVRLDENTTVPVDGGHLSVSDFLDNNIENVTRLYGRQVIGASGASEVYRAMTPATRTRPFKNFKELAEHLEKDALGKGIKKGKINSALKHLETLDNIIRGVPVTPNNAMSTFGRRLRAVNYLLRAGAFGAAQVPEVANPVMEAGFKASLTQMPELNKVFKAARKGDMPDGLIKEIEQISGIGSDQMLNRFFDKYDDIGTGAIEAGASKFDKQIHGLNHAQSVASGMVHVDTASRRIAGMLGSQRLVQFALEGKVPSVRRAAALGMEPDEIQSVMASIRKEIDRGVIGLEVGPFGRNKLASLHIDQWEDVQSATMFAQGLRRWADRGIQRNDPGQLAPFMTTEMGRILMQFRSFHVASWEKQFLHRIQMHDTNAATGAIFGMTIGGLVYTAQTYTRSIGRDDREEYLNTRLSTDSIAKAAFQRGGAASLLPGLIDTTLPLAGVDPQFSYRNTGLSSGFGITDLGGMVDSTPTSRLVSDFGRALQGATTALRTDEDYDRRDLDALTNLAPFQNVIGVRNGLRWLEQTLPEDEQ